MKNEANVLISNHNSMQEMANHYNNINWTLHSIFITINGLLLSMLLGFLLDENFTNFSTLFYLSLFGILNSLSWIIIFVRHRSMIMTFYKELHIIEEKIKKESEIEFKVHTIMKNKDMINNVKKKKVFFLLQLLINIYYFISTLIKRITKTKNVILVLQASFIIGYIIIGYVSRFLKS